MKTTIERTVIILIAVALVLYIVTAVLVHQQTKNCVGLKGVVEMVWEGKPCT